MLPIGAIKEVKADNDYFLVVKFYDGKTKRFDMKPLIKEDGPFKKLSNPALFEKYVIDGGGITWDEDLDIAQEYLYEHGIEVSS